MQTVFVALGVAAWIIAGVFGTWQTVELTSETHTPGFTEGTRLAVRAPSVASAGAAAGFAIAGGLCFVAAALVERGVRRKPEEQGGTQPPGKEAATYFERVVPKSPP